MRELLDFLATLTKAELDTLRGKCAPEHIGAINDEIVRRNDEEFKAHLEKERMSRVRRADKVT